MIMYDGQTISATLLYDDDHFDASTIQRFIGYFQVLLEGMVSAPDQPILQLPLLTDAEYRQIVYEWNKTTVDFGKPQTIHALFEQQVERNPKAVALVFEGEQLTYAELNTRANQLAHHLIELGVQADTLVAVAMQRSMEMVVSLLAVLKAGGVYVPIDPTYPSERIAFILHDCGTQFVLTEADLVRDLPDYEGQYVLVSGDRYCNFPSTNPTPQTTANHLAYVIYTSGSTGQPKGVLISHQNVWRLFTATDAWFNFNASDVWTLFHSFAF